MSRREQLEQLLQSEPEDVFLNYAMAMAMLADGDSPAGIEQLDRVIQLDPNYVAAYFQKGQALAGSGSTNPSKQVLKDGIEVAKRIGDSHAQAEMTSFLESL